MQQSFTVTRHIMTVAELREMLATVPDEFMTYKAERLGMSVALQNEAYTSQTCPCCGNRKKERSRVYRCPTCQFVGSRDGQVGAANILSQFLYSELARVQVHKTTYRHPCFTGKRKLQDTQHVAC